MSNSRLGIDDRSGDRIGRRNLHPHLSGDRKGIFETSGSLSPAKPTAIAKVRITALAIYGKVRDDRVLGNIGRKSL
ncbi:hypothetical protein [Coleofasciculus sp. H7-2]|uniref:hypothetical protein n=1 Tax=Coleofasciculus sp. H7-2 TaxID=3351545 RepID=UPI00367098B5